MNRYSLNETVRATNKPSPDRKTAIATGAKKYFGECKYGHGVKYTNSGICVTCSKLREHNRFIKLHPELTPSDTMLDIEKLKDEMELKKLIRGDDDYE